MERSKILATSGFLAIFNYRDSNSDSDQFSCDETFFDAFVIASYGCLIIDFVAVYFRSCSFTCMAFENFQLFSYKKHNMMVKILNYFSIKTCKRFLSKWRIKEKRVKTIILWSTIVFKIELNHVLNP